MTSDVATAERANWRRTRFALAALMLVPGVTHFLVPTFFEELVPSWVPGSPRFWNLSAGLAEITAGSLVANRRTERVGAMLALAVLVIVYPANIWDTIDHPPSDARGIGSLIRLPLQLPMFALAWRHVRGDRARSST